MLRPERILVGIDFSPTSNDVIKTLNSLDLDVHNQVVLVHVVPDLIALCSNYVAKRELADQQKRMEQKGLEMLEDFGRRKIKDCPKFISLIAKGNPADAVLKVARERKVNLIILGISAADKTEGNQFGSTAEKVLRDAPCPVLCVPHSGV